MSSGERWLLHSKLNRSLDRRNYQILLWPFRAENCCAYNNPGYTFFINFSCCLRYQPLPFFLQFVMKLKYNKEKIYQLIYFIFINLHTIQYIIYILLLTYYRISNTDTINELYKQTKIKVVFDTKTHVSITFLILFSSSRL